MLASDGAPVLMFESNEIGRLAPTLEQHGYSVRCVDHSPRSGLTFPRWSEDFENVFAGHEGINYVAVRQSGALDRFSELAGRSRASQRFGWRVLGSLG